MKATKQLKCFFGVCLGLLILFSNYTMSFSAKIRTVLLILYLSNVVN